MRFLRIGWQWFVKILFVLFLGILSTMLLTGSSIPPSDTNEQVRSFTRDIEFDYAAWIINALRVKVSQNAFSAQKFLDDSVQSDLVRAYLKQVENVMIINSQIELIFSDPNVTDPYKESLSIRKNLKTEQEKLERLAPLAESILQDQLSDILIDLGFGIGGQIIPSPLYQVTDLPLALIVSPRNRIERIADISLEAGMNIDSKEALESEILSELNFASLVVPVGGIGAYPTMVMQTTNLVWLSETIAHEWTHNYLTLRPLGINYNTSPELRTINETTASIAGKELGLALIAKYYPEFLPTNDIVTTPLIDKKYSSDPPPFDFRTEMRETRVTVDNLLDQGKIEEAEAYMENRRTIFWNNGYLIRKINQAYFAFYGAYNDEPGGGASGSDPIGPAVTALRDASPDLFTFLKTISRVNSPEELKSLTNLDW